MEFTVITEIWTVSFRLTLGLTTEAQRVAIDELSTTVTLSVSHSIATAVEKKILVEL